MKVKGDQLFEAHMKGEMSWDCGGPCRDICANMCEELMSAAVEQIRGAAIK